MFMSKKLAQVAAIGLALALIFSCSSGDDNGDSGCKSTDTHYCHNGTGTLEEYGYVTHGGQTYKTVEIGSQTWLAENLNYYEGDSKCENNNANNCAIYGRLYNWDAAMKSCPTDWHLPSDEEWALLAAFVGLNPATKLKARSGWEKSNGTDDYGFAALPSGFGNSRSDAFWWSITEVIDDDFGAFGALGSYINNDNMFLLGMGSDKEMYHSVRCIKD